MFEIDNAYWAGIIDGEGCISCQRDNRGLKKWFGYIALGNTAKILMDSYREYFGIHAQLIKREFEFGKTYYQIRSTGIEARGILEKILPYLKIKQGQARLVLVLLKFPEQRFYGHGNIPRQVRKLNRRGKI